MHAYYPHLLLLGKLFTTSSYTSLHCVFVLTPHKILLPGSHVLEIQVSGLQLKEVLIAREATPSSPPWLFQSYSTME
jgi:hypothetical protein